VISSPVVWTYTFSNFGTGQFFQFNWDPDIPGDGGYGAVVAEQLGLRIRVGTSAGEFASVLGPGGPNGGLHALIPVESAAPTPEPSSLLLCGTAAIGTFARGWRRRTRRQLERCTNSDLGRLA
jgi:PEP-CTERM motif-containing protein